ncbi:hypothetical protein DSO57_1010289 [Entomophthora muscae]|uniref:Uncharacterized protein n=1 Tax=Entomophthora muscae TaxID=34485 RepID=A0ACC2T6N4_9FUNG|nr:hypothetical protein DSO57_1010289 [Entomophthora muscae]
MQVGLIVAFVLGSGVARLLSREEFMNFADSFAKHALGTFNPTPAKCDSNLLLSESGGKECFVALVGLGDVPGGASSKVQMQLASPLDAIFYTENSFEKATKILDSGVDAVQLTMETHPECSLIRYDLETLANTMIGSGKIIITDTDSKRVTHGWKVGASVTYRKAAKEFLKNDTYTFSADYFGSIATTTTSSVGLHFDVPAGTTCTPHLLRYSVMCNPVSFRAQYFKNGSQISTKMSKLDATSKPFLMPIDHRTSDFFKVITGCIDLTL